MRCKSHLDMVEQMYDAHFGMSKETLDPVYCEYCIVSSKCFASSRL